MKTKKAKVIMLPTENKGIISINKHQKWFLGSYNDCSQYHLYITINEKPNVGYGLLTTKSVETNIERHTICKFIEGEFFDLKGDLIMIHHYNNIKTIIATTNKSLTIEIKPCMIAPYGSDDILPKIPLNFIKKYLDLSGVIDKILIEYESCGAWVNTIWNHIEYKLKLNNNNVIIHNAKTKWCEKDLLGNNEQSLDNFLLNSSEYTQEDTELIMKAIFEYINL